MAKENNNQTAQILIVDDEVEHAEVMGEALKRMGHVCTIVHGLAEAKDELAHGQFDLIVTDLVMENQDDGLNVLAAAKQNQPQAETILVTAHGDVPTCKAAIKQGAYDFIEKPLDLDVFRTLTQHAVDAVMLRQQNTHLREVLSDQAGFEGIIGTSQPISQIVGVIKQVAPSTIPVLITGESGTGKELVAKAIHNKSRRAKQHFAALNCAGFTESLLESELFGHVKGAFTGADRERQGWFEYADGGTLFLDEIGDMPIVMQAKLLRVLETGDVIRVGSTEPRHVDVRLVSATNRNLEEAVKNGTFREDLYYRIKVAPLHLPPLRDRREDVPLLARHFAQKFAAQFGKAPPEITEETMTALTRFDWPGNVRQLMNVMQNLVVLSGGEKLEARHLPPEVRAAAGVEPAETGLAANSTLSLDQLEKQAIRNALKIHGGNREAAAKMLGIGERTLYRKLREYGLK